MKLLSPEEALNSKLECKVEGGAKATTVRFFDPDLLEEGKQKARELGTSFSSYVSSLVCIDVKKEILFKTLLEELSEYYTSKVHPMSLVASNMCLDTETIYAIMSEKIGLELIDTVRENRKILKQKLEELDNNSQ